MTISVWPVCIGTFKPLSPGIQNKFQIFRQEKEYTNMVLLGAKLFICFMSDLRHETNRVLFHLAGTLMKHFLAGIPPLRH